MTAVRRRASAKALVLAVALSAAGSAPASPVTFRVDPERTRVEFAVTYLGIAKQRGRFDRAWGKIVLDSQSRSGSIDIIVDTASVNTGWNLRDAFLRGANMFDSERFPALRFHSTRLVFAAAQLVAVEGEITLRGVTRPLRLRVERVACATDPALGREGCGAAVIGHLTRSAFGMDYAVPFVGDDVELEFAIVAVRVRDDSEIEWP